MPRRQRDHRRVLPPGRVAPVEPSAEDRRGGGVPRIARRAEHDGKTVIKEETMPDGRVKLILKDESTGEFVDVVADAAPVA